MAVFLAWLYNSNSLNPHIIEKYDHMNKKEIAIGILFRVVILHLLVSDIPHDNSGNMMNSFPEVQDNINVNQYSSAQRFTFNFSTGSAYNAYMGNPALGVLTAVICNPFKYCLPSFENLTTNLIIKLSHLYNTKEGHLNKISFVIEGDSFIRTSSCFVWSIDLDGYNFTFPHDFITIYPANNIVSIGHPQTLVFISHCGNFGTQEAKFHGVPVLGVPISFDQHRNAARLARKGYGRVLNWDEMTVELIIKNINILIKDNSYRERIKMVSHALQDQKESPKERAVWWIEYAIRHKGAPHMHYAGKNLNAIQYYMIDVWAFLIAILLFCMASIYCCLRRCCRKSVCSKSKQ
ncbi:unnamed protein product, partial [Meganyctiphanes norvegica]